MICSANIIQLNNEIAEVGRNDLSLYYLIKVTNKESLEQAKESAKSAIEKLNKSGVRVIVLTGDNLWKTCLIIGAVMGISCLVIVITGGKRHGKEE